MKRFSQPRATTPLSKSLDQSLSAYALAAGAAGMGLLALAQPAEAKIVYTPAHAKVIVGQPLRMDLNHDGVVDFYLSEYRHDYVENLIACQHLIVHSTSGRFCRFSSGSTSSTNAVRAIAEPNGDVFAAALVYGEKIQRGGHFAKDRLLGEVGYNMGSGSDTSWLGPWLNGGKGVKHRYLGLKFKINGRLHFGWARISIAIDGDSFGATLTGYAYQTIPGKGLVAGQTKGPDVTTVSPATLGHLAAGASAIPAWRIKQTAATTH